MSGPPCPPRRYKVPSSPTSERVLLDQHQPFFALFTLFSCFTGFTCFTFFTLPSSPPRATPHTKSRYHDWISSPAGNQSQPSAIRQKTLITLVALASYPLILTNPTFSASNSRPSSAHHPLTVISPSPSHVPAQQPSVGPRNGRPNPKAARQPLLWLLLQSRGIRNS
ncbi:hypothetical protein BJ875DRAFT_287139 [Amylocarpus encephaloides]|uniref:Uncharacterized protein n=1 Tax=Amylocarpus encephaloides TaxID=45428 RepID=A0A9P8C7E4_9HELO|nr:hypothetical protein BJ875DRAFT_287139 [Amylocarpus encephaloides]